MLRSLVIAGLVAAGLTVTSTSQAAVLPADGALAAQTNVVTPVRYYGYGYGYYRPYYYHHHHRPYYGYYPYYGGYYYRPHRRHWWWRHW